MSRTAAGATSAALLGLSLVVATRGAAQDLRETPNFVERETPDGQPIAVHRARDAQIGSPRDAFDALHEFDQLAWDGDGVVEAGAWSFAWRYDVLGEAADGEWIGEEIDDIVPHLIAFTAAQGGADPYCAPTTLYVATMPEKDASRAFPMPAPWAGMYVCRGIAPERCAVILVRGWDNRDTLAHELGHYAWDRACTKPRLDSETFARTFESRLLARRPPVRPPPSPARPTTTPAEGRSNAAVERVTTPAAGASTPITTKPPQPEPAALVAGDSFILLMDPIEPRRPKRRGRRR